MSGQPEITLKDYLSLVRERDELRGALTEVYEKYVVEQFGERTCDCDYSVGILDCAPCKARRALYARTCKA